MNYTRDMPYSGSVRLPLRGGNWNNGANAGVFNCNLNNARSYYSSNIGFRSALMVKEVRKPYEARKPCKGAYLFSDSILQKKNELSRRRKRHTGHEVQI